MEFKLDSEVALRQFNARKKLNDGKTKHEHACNKCGVPVPPMRARCEACQVLVDHGLIA